MHWRKIGGLVLLGLGFTASAVAASVADAAEQRDEASLRTLLQSGVDVNGAQVDGDHCAALGRVFTIIRRWFGLLVRAGADVNAVNRYGVSPLVQACTNGDAKVVKLLLEAGADANTTMSGGGDRPHVGCTLREYRGGEGAARAWRRPPPHANGWTRRP